MLDVGCWMFACLFFALTTGAADSNLQQQDPNAITVEALSRLKGIDLETNPAVKTAVLNVLDQVRGTSQFVQIVRDFKIKGQGKGLLELVIKSPKELISVEAARLILGEGDFELLNKTLASSNAASLVGALSNIQEKEIVPLLLPLVTDSTREIALRKQAVHGLTQVQEGATALLELAKAQKLPDDLKLTASWELNAVRWPQVKTKATELFPPPRGNDSEPLPPISELAKLKGNPLKGAEVYRREAVGCIKCHQVKGEGIDFGPNLSEIGIKLGKDALYESILDPSAGISFGYEAWQIELKNDENVYGLLVSETEEELAVKTIGGIITHCKKADIVKREKQKLSIMPSGLQQAMSRQELVDLVEYLTTLKP